MANSVLRDDILEPVRHLAYPCMYSSGSESWHPSFFYFNISLKPVPSGITYKPKVCNYSRIPYWYPHYRKMLLSTVRNRLMYIKGRPSWLSKMAGELRNNENLKSSLAGLSFLIIYLAHSIIHITYYEEEPSILRSISLDRELNGVGTLSGGYSIWAIPAQFSKQTVRLQVTEIISAFVSSSSLTMKNEERIPLAKFSGSGTVPRAGFCLVKLYPALSR